MSSFDEYFDKKEENNEEIVETAVVEEKKEPKITRKQVKSKTKDIKEDRRLERLKKKAEKKAGKRNTYLDITGLLVGLFIGSMFYLVFMTFIYKEDPVFFLIAIMVGMFSWFWLGVPLGAIFIDTYLRTRLLRLITKRNYGVVHLVSKGKTIATMVKDLDESIIQKKDSMWGIAQGYIYNLNKKNIKHEITPEMIKYIGVVPTLYLDYDTVKPLNFYKEKSPLSPKQLSGSLVGWAMIQKKKAVRMQKQINVMYIIIAVLVCVAIYLTFQNYQLLQQIGAMISELKSTTAVL